MQRPATGKVPACKGTSTHLLPVLGRVPSPTGGLSHQTELTIKATHTGILFLGGYDDYAKKIIPQGKFKKRYLGSKTCQVDINGKLYLSAKEYQQAVNPKKGVKGSRDKKKAGTPPRFSELSVAGPATMDWVTEPTAISQEITTCANIGVNNATNIASKERKKEYTVNKSQVRQRIYGMINTQKGRHRLFFWTVSFPEGTPDDICYKAFNTWLTSLRKSRLSKDGKTWLSPMLKDYLWIAERQDGKRAAEGKDPTNTIHFHIAIPHYMDVTKANAMMRGTLKNLSKSGAMPGAVCNIATRKMHFLPCVARYNGVDICKNRKTNRVINFAIKKGSRALSHYLTKYVTKNNAGVPDENGQITTAAFTHLAWHNSRGFSALFTGVTLTIAEFTERGFGHFLNRVRVFKMRFAVFIPWLYGPPPLFEDHLYKLNSYIQSITDGTGQSVHTS